MRTVHKRSRDAQRAFPESSCAHCGGELYSGDTCWRLGGRVLCPECAARWALSELACFRVTVGEVEG